MKKVFFVSCVLLVLGVVFIFLFEYFRPVSILSDVKIYRHLDGHHYLYYQDREIGYVSGLDSWYVQGSQVYGSLSNKQSSDISVRYFYIDVCYQEIYITLSRFDFHDFLDDRNIDQNKRNYMSGNNIISPNQYPYDKNVTCP